MTLADIICLNRTSVGLKLWWRSRLRWPNPAASIEPAWD